MTCAMVKVLPEPVTPSSTWSWSPRSQALDQLDDRLRLVARRLEVRDQLERLPGLRPLVATRSGGLAASAFSRSTVSSS